MLASPLLPAAITQSMVDALPVHAPGDTTSDLSSSYEAIALFCHACMVNLGFRLEGLTQDDKIRTLQATLHMPAPVRLYSLTDMFQNPSAKALPRGCPQGGTPHAAPIPFSTPTRSHP